MLIACWSVKGGSGTTVIATALALLLARSTDAGVVLADLGGDVPAACGVPEPLGPGLIDFAAAGDDVPIDAFDRLETKVTPSLALLHAGGEGPGPGGAGAGAQGAALRSLGSADGERVALALTEHYRTGSVVVDCGPPGLPFGNAVAAAAGLSLLVLRPCYLALRRAAQSEMRPSGVVLISEPGRSLGPTEVSDVLGVPVRAEVPFDPAVARVVDAGLLSTRVPRCIERALRVAA